MTVPDKPPAPIGVVLAGGQSQRMGTDKAALCVKGEPLLLRARRLLLDSGCKLVILSGPARANWPWPCIADTLPQCGPVGGMVSCLQALLPNLPVQTTVVFVAVDTPLLSPALLTSLWQAGAGQDGALYADHPLPLVLTHTPKLVAQVQQSGLLSGVSRSASAAAHPGSGKSLSIRTFIQGLDMAVLATSPQTQQQLINLNTPSDWQRLQDECTH